MQTKEVIINIRTERPKPAPIRWERQIFRLSLVFLSAMIFARLVLLMIDVIQLKVGTPGAFAIPAYAAVFIFTGWKLREWASALNRKEVRR